MLSGELVVALACRSAGRLGTPRHLRSHLSEAPLASHAQHRMAQTNVGEGESLSLGLPGRGNHLAPARPVRTDTPTTLSNTGQRMPAPALCNCIGRMTPRSSAKGAQCNRIRETGAERSSIHECTPPRGFAIGAEGRAPQKGGQGQRQAERRVEPKWLPKYPHRHACTHEHECTYTCGVRALRKHGRNTRRMAISRKSFFHSGVCRTMPPRLMVRHPTLAVSG